MSHIGTSKIGGMYLGSTKIDKAYLGSQLVYSSWVEPTPNHACLTFRSTSAMTISLTCNGSIAPVLYYSTDGTTWTLWDYSAISFSPKHPVFIYGLNSSGFSSSATNYATFTCGGSGFVDVDGDVMVLIDGVGDTLTIPCDYCFYSLFMRNTAIRTPPSFSATTLKSDCYERAFYGCYEMSSAPELPALTSAYRCYYQMFYACRALVTPMTILPATTLANQCYGYMFYNCTAMTTAPILPALTLVTRCYYKMFQTDAQLSYVKAMFTTTPSDTYTLDWLNGVSSSGTFVKNSVAAWTNTGTNAIPASWTIETASS